jgi:hypothetical protein
MPLPGTPTVGVPYLEPTSKFVCVFWAPDNVRGGCNIYAGSSRTSLHLVFDGLRYLHLC